MLGGNQVSIYVEPSVCRRLYEEEHFSVLAVGVA